MPLGDVLLNALSEHRGVAVPLRRRLQHLQLRHRIHVVPTDRIPLIPPTVLAPLHALVKGGQVRLLLGRVVEPSGSPSKLVAKAPALVLRRHLCGGYDTNRSRSQAMGSLARACGQEGAGQVQARCRRGAGQVQARCRPGAGQVQARCRPGSGQVQPLCQQRPSLMRTHAHLWQVLLQP